MGREKNREQDSSPPPENALEPVATSVAAPAATSPGEEPDSNLTPAAENSPAVETEADTYAGQEEAAPPHPQETCKEYLRRYFTPEEREILANQADQAHAELIQANEEKATFNANIKSRITNLEGEIARLHRLRQAGFEMDHIECVITRDFNAKEVLIHRADTGDFVRKRRMTLDEQQRSLLTPETAGEVAEHFGLQPGAETEGAAAALAGEEEGSKPGAGSAPPTVEDSPGTEAPMTF